MPQVFILTWSPLTVPAMLQNYLKQCNSINIIQFFKIVISQLFLAMASEVMCFEGFYYCVELTHTDITNYNHACFLCDWGEKSLTLEDLTVTSNSQDSILQIAYIGYRLGSISNSTFNGNFLLQKWTSLRHTIQLNYTITLHSDEMLNKE